MFRELEAGNSELFMEYYKKGGDIEKCCNIVWGGYGRWGGGCSTLKEAATHAYGKGNKEPLYVFIKDRKVGTNAMRSGIAGWALSINDTILVRELIHDYNTTLMNLGGISKEKFILLKEMGYDFSKSDEDGRNILTSYFGGVGIIKLEVVQYLIEAGADPCSVLLIMTKNWEEILERSYDRAEALKYIKQFDCCSALIQRIKELENKINNDDYEDNSLKYVNKEHDVEILEHIKENLITELGCK